MNMLRSIGVCVVMVLVLCGNVLAQENRATTLPGEEPWPFVHIDHKNKTVEMDAKVILRDAPWLELLACTPGTREHESILTVLAKPSHLHLALLLVGLEPGTPMHRQTVAATQSTTQPTTITKLFPPTGAKVKVTILLQEQGQWKEISPTAWIENRKTKKRLENDQWLFAGSSMADTDDGQRVYRADYTGNVLSLVSFGDEVLAKPTTITNNDDDEMWGCVKDAIPPVGTVVRIRLQRD